MLDRAWAVCGGEPIAKARILLQKETVLDLMGDIEGALAVLSEATPLIEEIGDRDLLLRLLFNMAVDLFHLERFSEAAAMLPRVRELAIEQANELDLLRLVWLQARIDARQGRVQKALTALESVSQKFADLELPYDAALAALDLAVLWLEAGHTAKVRELAVEMEAIFRVKKVHREAFAALTLFWETAQRETATVELVRRIIAEIEKAKRSAPSSERPR